MGFIKSIFKGFYNSFSFILDPLFRFFYTFSRSRKEYNQHKSFVKNFIEDVNRKRRENDEVY